MDKSVQSIESQLKWNAGNCPWDISHAEMRRKAREILGLIDFLNPEKEWQAADLIPYAKRIRFGRLANEIPDNWTEHDLERYTEQIKTHTESIKLILNYTVAPQISNVQLVHQFLSQLGLRTQFRWITVESDGQKKRERVYRLNADVWDRLKEILETRTQLRIERKQRREQPDHPPIDGDISQGGDQCLDDQFWNAIDDQFLDSELRKDVLALWSASTTQQEKSELLQFVVVDIKPT